MRRRFPVFALCLILAGGLSTPTTVLAGSDIEIQESGIKAFDDVFMQAKEIDDTLTQGRQQRRQARAKVSEALGLERGTLFTESLKELQSRAEGKITVALNGTTPTLSVSDAVPSDIQAAVDAANAAVRQYEQMGRNLADIPAQCQAVAKAAKKFPDQIKDEVGNFSLSGLKERGQQLKIIKNNIKATLALPDQAATLTKNLAADVQSVTEIFQ